MFTKRLLFLLPLILLAACDCLTVVKGRIISNASKVPINGATIELVGKNKVVKSDNRGQFRIEYVSGFCFDPKVRVTAENCKSFEIKLRSSKNSKSYELKSELKFIDFEKPFYPDSSNHNTFITGTWINNYSQNFTVTDDSLIISLDTDNVKQEIENIQHTIKNND